MLIAHFRQVFRLSDLQSGLVQSAFYLGCFCFAIPAALACERFGYKAADFVGRGIRCNAIRPGTVDTPSLQQRLRDTGDYAAAQAAFVARQPMGRLGQAVEIAALTTYLASDEAAFTTGAVHVMDGGWVN